MELRVNDYVRTNEFGIQKVKWFVNEEPILENGFTALQKEYKSSPNIIDLIEVGDYVNGCEIIELATNIDGKVLYLETNLTEFDNVYACGNINIYEKDIKSIVTKECFESMEYKVKE